MLNVDIFTFARAPRFPAILRHFIYSAAHVFGRQEKIDTRLAKCTNWASVRIRNC